MLPVLVERPCSHSPHFSPENGGSMSLKSISKTTTFTLFQHQRTEPLSALMQNLSAALLFIIETLLSGASFPKVDPAEFSTNQYVVTVWKKCGAFEMNWTSCQRELCIYIYMLLIKG